MWVFIKCIYLSVSLSLSLSISRSKCVSLSIYIYIYFFFFFLFLSRSLVTASLSLPMSASQLRQKQFQILCWVRLASRPFLKNYFHPPLKWVQDWVCVNIPKWVQSRFLKSVLTHFHPLLHPKPHLLPTYKPTSGHWQKPSYTHFQWKSFCSPKEPWGNPDPPWFKQKSFKLIG